MSDAQNPSQHSPPKRRIESELDRIEVIDIVMVDIFKQKSYLERLKIAFSLWSSARMQLFYNLRSLHPDWNEQKIASEVASRISHGTA
jgi:hypothetical protein